MDSFIIYILTLFVHCVMKRNNINSRLKSKLVNKANGRIIAQNIDMRFIGYLAAKFGVVDSTCGS